MLGRQLGLVEAMTGSTENLSVGDWMRLFRGRSAPLLPMADLDEKEAVHGFKAFTVMAEGGDEYPYPTFSGQALCREHFLGRGVHWLSPPDL